MLFVEESSGSYRAASKDEVLKAALRSLRVQRGIEFSSPSIARNWITLRIGALENEVFCVAYLDSRNRLIEFIEEFRGTIGQTSVYPREILKRALRLNARSVVLAHNHPSGNHEPSSADCLLTKVIKDALALIDVQVLDHFVIGGDQFYSFAENGLVI